MKTNLKFLSLAAALFFFFGCADEHIEPQITDDIKTSAAVYADQFLTFQITTNEDTDFEFWLYGNGGKVSINWGDGKIEKKVVYEDYQEFYHRYVRVKNYTITISGDIKTITYLAISNENLIIKSIYFGGVTNLETLTFYRVPNGPEVINLSQNRSIGFFQTIGSPRLTDIILPVTNKIHYFDIAGRHKLSTAVVDRLVARIHDSVVNNPRQGIFDLRLGYTIEDWNSMVGPPSSYAVNKLRKLQNVYGWIINPTVE